MVELYLVRRADRGAFMEPSGCNRWQPVANAPRPKTRKTSRNRCRRLRPVADYYNAEGIGYSDETIHFGTYDASLDQLEKLEGEVTVEVID
jgi:hypothetical protein